MDHPLEPMVESKVSSVLNQTTVKLSLEYPPTNTLPSSCIVIASDTSEPFSTSATPFDPKELSKVPSVFRRSAKISPVILSQVYPLITIFPSA
nr:hypothetical protein [Aequorivita sinensis]